MFAQVFQCVTKLMSHSQQPLIADAIPLINLLDEQLKVLVANSKQPMIIHASAAKDRAVLNKYYSKTDDLRMYHLYMSMWLLVSYTFAESFVVLHPRYKMSYFNKATWESDWIDTAQQIIQEEWETHYQPTIDPSFMQQEDSDTTQRYSVRYFSFVFLFY